MGTSGPLTAASAREMASVLFHLPHTPGQPSRVWWQAVWASYKGKAPRPFNGTGEPRTIITDGRELLDSQGKEFADDDEARAHAEDMARFFGRLRRGGDYHAIRVISQDGKELFRVKVPEQG